MVAEVLAALKPKPGGRYADGTVGGAGHAAAILKASAPSGWLFGCDRDDAALELAALRLAEFAGRFELRRGNLAELSDRKSTRLNSSHGYISYAVFCLKKKKRTPVTATF